MSSLRALAVLAALTLAPSTALAEPEDPVVGVAYVFATVDAYTVGPGYFNITGILVGETTPRVFRFSAGGNWETGSLSTEASRCDRLALLAMTRPGRYLMTWTEATYSSSPACTLTRQ